MPKLDTSKSPLIAEFLKDHQQFSRLLYQISKLLDANEISEARQRAIELDRMAGAHIAYEEAELYPRLQLLGEREATEQLLVGQHHEALDAVRELVDDDNPNPEAVERIKAGFKDALKHAEHCGSLISLMSQLGEEQQIESLEILNNLRRAGTRWTELES